MRRLVACGFYSVFSDVAAFLVVVGEIAVASAYHNYINEGGERNPGPADRRSVNYSGLPAEIVVLKHFASDAAL